MVSETEQSSESAVEPVLVSDLLALQQRRKERYAKLGYDTLLKTECPEIDEEVLAGGWVRGRVVGLSGDLAVGRLVGSFYPQMWLWRCVGGLMV